MKHTLLAAAAALLLTGPAARAETFDLSVIGSGTHWYVHGVPGCDFANPVDGCNFGFATETWLGDLVIRTASAQDGAYTFGAGLLSVTYSSNFDGFSDDQQHLVYPQFNGGDPYLAGLAPGASVTVAGGRVTDVTGSFAWDGSGSLDFIGMTVADIDGGQPGQPNADWWELTGMLADGSSPASSTAPEPATWLLFVVGTGALMLRKIAPCAGTHSPHSSSR